MPAAPAGRIAATLALLGFAALAAVSGLDRMSVAAPALGRLVPSALQAQSARSEAALAIVRREPGPAVAGARRAVASDPVNPASTALLGSAYLLAGQGPEAERAFRVAARFGWREPATQLYWYEAALQSGELPLAVDRADALLRAHKGFSAADQVLLPLESTPAGRAALARRMADRPGWLAEYLRPGPDEAVLARRTEVLVELGKTTRLGCGLVTPFVQAAITRGERRQAERVWLAHCPGASLAQGIADGGFEQLEAETPSPFGWRQQLSGDVTLRVIGKPGGGHAVELSNGAPVSRLVLYQAVSLEPGTYRLTGKARRGRMAGSLGCDEPPKLPSLTDGDMGAGGQVLRVPRCSSLTLALWLRPGAGPVELDDVALRRLD